MGNVPTARASSVPLRGVPIHISCLTLALCATCTALLSLGRGGVDDQAKQEAWYVYGQRREGHEPEASYRPRLFARPSLPSMPKGRDPRPSHRLPPPRNQCNLMKFLNGLDGGPRGDSSIPHMVRCRRAGTCCRPLPRSQGRRKWCSPDWA